MHPYSSKTCPNPKCRRYPLEFGDGTVRCSNELCPLASRWISVQVWNADWNRGDQVTTHELLEAAAELLQRVHCDATLPEQDRLKHAVNVALAQSGRDVPPQEDPKSDQDAAQRYAERLASSLFTNGAGKHADRLVLTVDGTTELKGEDLGGLCERAVVDRVRETILAVRRHALAEHFRVRRRLDDSRRWGTQIEFSELELRSFHGADIEKFVQLKLAGLARSLRSAMEAKV